MPHRSDRESRNVLKILTAFSAVILFSAFGPILSAAAQNKQLSLADILIALRSKKAELNEKNRLLSEAVKARGITFKLTPEIEKELSITGAYSGLLDAIRSKTVRTEPVIEQTPEMPIQPQVVTISPPVRGFEFYRNRANKEISANKPEAAVDDLTKAINFKPLDAGSYLARALAYLKLEKPSESIKDLEKLIEIDGKNSTAYLIRAQIYERLGRNEKALADYSTSFALDASNTESQNAISRLRQAIKVASMPTAIPDPANMVSVDSRSLSVGALNYNAVYLVSPKYSKEAQRLGLRGRVRVLVSLDERGRILSATAAEGPLELRLAAEQAAKRSKFKPVRVGDKNVRAAGFIVYNFPPDQ